MLTKPVVLVGALLSFAAGVFAMPDSGELECNAKSGPKVNAGECLGNATPISTPHHNNIINENSCEMDAGRGMCVTEEFFGRCSPEQHCLSRPDFGASVLVPVDDSPGDCSDFEKNCEAFAANAQCVINPGYMLTECPKSCYVCFVDGTNSQSKTVEVSIGVRQELPSGATESLKSKFFEVIAGTASYMTNEVFAQEEFEEARRDCRNYEPTCAWKVASSGGSYCEDEEEMRICGPACKACDEMIFDDDELYLLKHCEMDERKNIFDNDKSAFSFEDSNTIDAMFRRIVGELPYPTNVKGETYPIVPGVNYTYTILSRPSLNPKIHKRIPLSSMNFHIGGPWIVVLDDFLTEEECDRLIELGDLLGRERSTVEEDLDDDDDDEDDDTESGDTNDNTRNDDNKASEDDEKDKGTTSDDDNETKDWRTSSNAWCDETICMNDPIAMRVEQRIKLTTGVTDTDYYEHLQLLKYSTYQTTLQSYITSGLFSALIDKIKTATSSFSQLVSFHTNRSRTILHGTPRRVGRYAWQQI